MLVVYHIPGTRSMRIVWLLRELALPHEVELMRFHPEDLRSPQYLRVNPLGKVPTLCDGDVTLAESGAIAQYLLARYGDGRLEPRPRPEPGSPGHAAFLYWLHFAEATVMPHLGIQVRQTRLPPGERDERTLAHARAKAGEMVAHVAEAVCARPYVLGEVFTAPDIMLGYSLHLADRLGLVPDGPAGDYLARLRSREHFPDE